MDQNEYERILSTKSIVFLSKPNCKWCVELSTYLQTNNIDFNKIDVNELDYGVELVELVKKKYTVKNYPICFKDSKFVGSKDELIEAVRDSKFNDINNI